MLQAGNFREIQNSSTSNCREISETSTNEYGIETNLLLKHIEGMEVSVDVSTCDADAGHRYFGTVTEISELDTAKNGYILLVQDAKPNFKQAGKSTSKCSLRDGIEAIRNTGIPVDVDKIQSECVAGNSPVTPDTWIPVSERRPENKPGSYEYIVFESLNNRAHHDYWNVPDSSCDDFAPFWNHYGKYVTHWMPLPAAPKQEVK
ncbi:DUF551 domain-containing protein [Salmonella enterica subsp. houtenae]|nr:DUF551 domain-containing protein [Salmonella enterica subsp. houtenae]